MIEAAIKKGLDGMIITDHDSVRGGLVGRKEARTFKDFRVVPGAEVTSLSGHILAIGVETDIPKGLSVDETIERIHDLGGISVTSHPFSNRVRPSLEEQCLETDAVEVFNATNTLLANRRAISLAEAQNRPRTAGSDAHWTRLVGKAGVIADDPITDIKSGRARIFGEYAHMWDLRMFNFRQLSSALVKRPRWK
jgi:predicted metal-dependent phosphoesterase TrpH